MVTGSTWRNSSGIGPSFRTARAYIPRQQESVKPFRVPRQEMTISTNTTVPAVSPNTRWKAILAAASPLAISSSVVTAPVRPM